MDRYRVEKGDSRAYLCTCAFQLWLPVFNCGPQYFQIILDSLVFCRKSKGLILHAYVLMVDHLHLIARHEDVSDFMRDFKTWNSRKITEQLKQEGRTDFLKLFQLIAPQGSRPQEFRVWQDGFHPKSIVSDAMMLQKLRYIHNNPVRKGFVKAPEDWRYSSAGSYLTGGQGVLKIDHVGPLIV